MNNINPISSSSLYSIDKHQYKNYYRSTKLSANIYKARLGESVVEDSLTSLHIPYTDSTKVFNFRNRELGSKKKNNVADFTIGDFAIGEVKNWDCEGRGYKVTVAKVETEILARFNECTDKLKILVISSPIWAVGARELLKGNNVIIIELGYPITSDNLVEAKNDVVRHLRRVLGYVYTSNNKYTNSLIFSINNILDRLSSIFSSITLDKWIEKKSESKPKEENTSGDSVPKEERLKMSQEEDKTFWRSYPTRKKRKGILRLCERCGSTFFSYHGERVCPDCIEDCDSSTRIFGTPLDGLLDPFDNRGGE